ncbi:MAG TPA: hypothetical protein VLM89_13590, partial [Phycisphaerae bacterium]|nr:hypothetical protein [Phycisphaerae bacterium]
VRTRTGRHADRSRRCDFRVLGRTLTCRTRLAIATPASDNILDMAGQSRKEYVNVHGRKGGRGSRPYFLVFKLVCVAGFLGGLMALLAVTAGRPVPVSQAQWQERADLISRVFRWVIIPGVTGAEIAGVILLVSIWRALIRMRWFVVKIILVLVCMPAFHLILSTRSERLQAIVAAGTDLPAAAEIHSQMLAGSATALVVGLVLLILGRIKPRLGQSYGRTFARPDG